MDAASISFSGAYLPRCFSFFFFCLSKTFAPFPPPVFPGSCLSLRFPLFLLQLQSLLRFCPNPCLLRLPVCLALEPLGIMASLSDCSRHSRTKSQAAILFEDEGVHLLLLWLRPKGHFGDGEAPLCHALKDAHPKRVLKKYGQLARHFVHNNSSFMICGKQRTDDPRREGYLHLSVRPGYLPALQGRDKGRCPHVAFLSLPFDCSTILSIGLQGLVLHFFYAAGTRRSKKEKLPAGRLGWVVRIGSRAGGFSLTKAPHKPGKLNFVQFHVAQDKSKIQQNI